MDEHQDKEAWAEAIASFLTKYQNGGSADPYWRALQFFRLGDVVAGIEAAALESPEEMPSANTVAERVREFARGHMRADQAEFNIHEIPARVAQDPQSYIDGATDRYERFARQWEAGLRGRGTGTWQSSRRARTSPHSCRSAQSRSISTTNHSFSFWPCHSSLYLFGCISWASEV